MRRLLLPFTLLFAFPVLAQELLKLEWIVNTALERNPQIKSLGEQIEAQKFRITPDRTLPDPVLGLSIKNIGLDRFTLGREAMSGFGFSFSQKIPFPGKLNLKGEIASIKASSLEERFKAFKLSLIRECKELYSELFYYHKYIEILRKKKEFLEKALKITEVRYSVGEGLQSDIFKAQVEISKINEMFISMNQMLKTIEGKINSLLDFPQETPLGKPEEILLYSLEYQLNDLIEQGKKSPFIKQAELMIDESVKEVEFSKKEFYPDFMIEVGKEFKGPFKDMYELMIGVEIPIYWKRKQQNILNASISNLKSSKNSYESMKNEIFFRINENYIMAKASENLINLYRERIIPQSEMALESSLANYRVGKVDFLTLLSDIDNLFSFEIDYYRELRNLWIAVAKIEEFTSLEIIKENPNEKIN